MEYLNEEMLYRTAFKDSKGQYDKKTILADIMKKSVYEKTLVSVISCLTIEDDLIFVKEFDSVFEKLSMNLANHLIENVKCVVDTIEDYRQSKYLCNNDDSLDKEDIIELQKTLIKMVDMISVVT